MDTQSVEHLGAHVLDVDALGLVHRVQQLVREIHQKLQDRDLVPLDEVRPVRTAAVRHGCSAPLRTGCKHVARPSAERARGVQAERRVVGVTQARDGQAQVQGLQLARGGEGPDETLGRVGHQVLRGSDGVAKEVGRHGGFLLAGRLLKGRHRAARIISDWK